MHVTNVKKKHDRVNHFVSEWDKAIANAESRLEAATERVGVLRKAPLILKPIEKIQQEGGFMKRATQKSVNTAPSVVPSKLRCCV